MDVVQTVAAVVRLIEPTARASGVKIALVGSPAVHIRADEAELQHALINIVLNAVQACRGGGEVSIAIQAGSNIHVRVTDTGCGIAAEDRARIFEPFFSLRGGGTGLGLFLALNFVKRCGGEIVVTSAPAGGSTFDVVLPAATASAAALRSAS
jgi:two-component system sensor histidine kinase FlrB